VISGPDRSGPGPVPGSEGVFVATGHGTLGLTLAPSTAAALVPMVLHDDAVPLLAPFAVERFGRRGMVSAVAPGVQTRPSRGS
jgi:glycine/D-amino acid oxidase-like deaminating enzyme